MKTIIQKTAVFVAAFGKVLGAAAFCALLSSPAFAGTITLQTVQDGRILNENPDLQYHNTVLSVYNTPGNTQHTLLLFDFSSILPGQTIVSATLSMVKYDSVGGIWTQTGGRHADVFAATTNWNAQNATWNSSDTGVHWGTPGGDYDPTVFASNSDTILGGVHPMTWDVTSLVLEWVYGTRTNYGMLLGATTGDTLHFYSSRDGIGLAPSLTIQTADAVPESAGTVTLMIFAGGLIALFRRWGTIEVQWSSK